MDLPPLETMMRERKEMQNLISELTEYKAELEENLAKSRERLLELEATVASLRQPKKIRRWSKWKE